MLTFVWPGQSTWLKGTSIIAQTASQRLIFDLPSRSSTEISSKVPCLASFQLGHLHPGSSLRMPFVYVLQQATVTFFFPLCVLLFTTIFFCQVITLKQVNYEQCESRLFMRVSVSVSVGLTNPCHFFLC